VIPYRNGLRLGNAMMGLGFVVFIGYVLVIRLIFGSAWEIVLQILGLGLAVAGGLQNVRTGRRFTKPTTEEKMFLDVYDVLKNIREYSQDGYEDTRARASKKMRKIISSMDGFDWEVGRLELARRELGQPLVELRQSLNQRLFAAVDHGDPILLSKGVTVLERLAFFLADSSLTTLKEVNQVVSTLPYVERPEPVRMSIIGLIRQHPRWTHAIAVTTFLIVNGVFFYVTTGFLGIEKNTAIIACVTLFATFITVYFLRPKIK